MINGEKLLVDWPVETPSSSLQIPEIFPEEPSYDDFCLRYQWVSDADFEIIVSTVKLFWNTNILELLNLVGYTSSEEKVQYFYISRIKLLATFKNAYPALELTDISSFCNIAFPYPDPEIYPLWEIFENWLITDEWRCLDFEKDSKFVEYSDYTKFFELAESSSIFTNHFCIVVLKDFTFIEFEKYLRDRNVSLTVFLEYTNALNSRWYLNTHMGPHRYNKESLDELLSFISSLLINFVFISSIEEVIWWLLRENLHVISISHLSLLYEKLLFDHENVFWVLKLQTLFPVWISSFVSMFMEIIQYQWVLELYDYLKLHPADIIIWNKTVTVWTNAKTMHFFRGMLRLYQSKGCSVSFDELTTVYKYNLSKVLDKYSKRDMLLQNTDVIFLGVTPEEDRTFVLSYSNRIKKLFTNWAKSITNLSSDMSDLTPSGYLDFVQKYILSNDFSHLRIFFCLHWSDKWDAHSKNWIFSMNHFERFFSLVGGETAENVSIEFFSCNNWYKVADDYVATMPNIFLDSSYHSSNVGDLLALIQWHEKWYDTTPDHHKRSASKWEGVMLADFDWDWSVSYAEWKVHQALSHQESFFDRTVSIDWKWTIIF